MQKLLSALLQYNDMTKYEFEYLVKRLSSNFNYNLITGKEVFVNIKLLHELFQASVMQNVGFQHFFYFNGRNCGI